MKVLWVCNTVFPDLAKDLNKPIPVVGGWMYGLADALNNTGQIKLAVATSLPRATPVSKQIGPIRYYLLKGSRPREKYDAVLEKQWTAILKEFQPDVIHIHGTEFAPGLALLKRHPEQHMVVSIQGMTSVYARYYKGGIAAREILRNITFKDLVKGATIFHDARKFQSRGQQIEKEYLRHISHAIGRTRWDHDHVRSINPSCQYHFCNESLRDPFYRSPGWDTNKKKDYSIFLSQALYPIKGLHKVLDALSFLKNDFPELQVRVAGPDITGCDSLTDKLRLSGYGKLIRSRIRRYGLKRNITFTGPLNAAQMIAEYTRAHVFVCPSSIENSPNSLGEAQLLGVPCVAAYVGGIPDMVQDEKSGLLYRFEEVEMLAQALRRIFTDDTLAEELGKGGRKAARNRHDREENALKMLAIYKAIISTTGH